MILENKIGKVGILVIFSICFVFHSISNAAQPIVRSGQSVPAATVIKTPQLSPAKNVLQSPILVTKVPQPSLSLYQSLLAATERVHKAYSPIRFTDCPSNWFNLEEVYYSGYNSYIKNCANKSYSVQDQVAAGCKGNDTVDLCTDKLFRHCLSRYEESKSNYNTSNSLKSRIAKGIEKSDKITSEARDLSDALRNLKNLMP